VISKNLLVVMLLYRCDADNKRVLLFDRVAVADNFFTRLNGLIFKRYLSDGEGLLLTNCSSIHTMWMRFKIDVIFLGTSGKTKPGILTSGKAETGNVAPGSFTSGNLTTGKAIQAILTPGNSMPGNTTFGNYRVIDIIENMKPFTFSRIVTGATDVLELKNGSIAKYGIKKDNWFFIGS